MEMCFSSDISSLNSLQHSFSRRTLKLFNSKLSRQSWYGRPGAIIEKAPFLNPLKVFTEVILKFVMEHLGSILKNRSYNRAVKVN